jgi:anti-anti-sigma factor
MEGIQVSTEMRGSQNQISLIKVGGFIDTTTSSEVERSLHNLLKQNRFNIIIDLGNVDYISSAGWGIFISEIKAIRENNGDLKLVRMIPDVYEIFELLEFHHILDVYDSVDEAVKKFEDGVQRPTAAAVAREFAEVSKTPVGTPSSTSPLIQQESEYTSSDDSFEEELSEVADVKPDELSVAATSVEEKVQHIVARNPNIGAYKIKKMLNSSRYGFSRVGWFKVRSILSDLNLKSRKRRKEFAQRSMNSEQ